MSASLVVNVKDPRAWRGVSWSAVPVICSVKQPPSTVLRGADIDFLTKFASQMRFFSQDYDIKRSLQGVGFPTKSTS